MITPYEYYSSSVVRNRIGEYCGGDYRKPETFSCEYLVGYGEFLKNINENAFKSFKVSELFNLFREGCDILRSNWDRKYILGIFDMEYINFDIKGEVFLNESDTFRKMEPLHRDIRGILDDYGINYIDLMTGQGYHFAFQVPLESDLYTRLAGIGKINQSLRQKYQSTTLNRDKTVSVKYGEAFDGIGRLLEYLTHLIIKRYNKKSIPLVCTDVKVGSPAGNREAISLDLSCYGDPVYMRDVRTAFSTYRKHKIKTHLLGAGAASAMPYLLVIPRQSLALDEVFAMRRHYQNTHEYAKSTSACIPVSAKGLRNLYYDYLSSDLYRFHGYFDAGWHDEPAEWPGTYDRFDINVLPPCIRDRIVFPNPYLMQPTHIQTLTRLLLKLDWHPKDIAGFLRSKYERNYNWGAEWFKYDAATRADFYVRMFSGLIADGLDDSEDLNCVSHQEKDCCVRPSCGFNLSAWKPASGALRLAAGITT